MRKAGIRKRITGLAAAGIIAVCAFSGSMTAQETAEAAAETVLEEETGIGQEPEGMSEAAEEITEPAETQDEPDVTLAGIRYAKSYKEIYEEMKPLYYDRYYILDGLDYAYEEAAVEDSGAPAAADTMATGSAAESKKMEAGTDYSETNLREAGVDEADIVKTDGRYLYILDRNEKTVTIVSAEGAASSRISSIDLAQIQLLGGEKTGFSPRDLYIDGDILCVTMQEYKQTGFMDKKSGMYYPLTDNAETTLTSLYTFDLADRENPVLKGCVCQDGVYRQSRKKGDYIYLFSAASPVLEDSYEDSRMEIMAGDTVLEPEEIFIPNKVTDARYLLISSIDLNDPSETRDHKAFVSGAGEFYVSPDNIYLLNEDYSSYQTRTEIAKFHYENGKIDGTAACYLKGYVNNSFSLDEYNGDLRVLTTYMGSDYGAFKEWISDLFGLDYYDEDRWTRHNALYVLDDQLKKKAKLSGIARNEEVRSARWFGDHAYFVTFENTDPLFTVDLSDPTHPKLTDELKVTGFSSYLHPYGDRYLLGIGYEADEDTGIVTGLKLSMFDISEGSVKETDRLVLPGITWCPAIEDYKSILVSPQRNLIGFFCNERYMVFSYQEGTGFSRELLYDYYEDMLNGTVQYDQMRGLFVQEELYLAGNTGVIGFDMADQYRKNLVLPLEPDRQERAD